MRIAAAGHSREEGPGAKQAVLRVMWPAVRRLSAATNLTVRQASLWTAAATHADAQILKLGMLYETSSSPNSSVGIQEQHQG